MKIRRSEHFKQSYHKLSPVLRKRVDKALTLLAMNVRHPSLRIKKIQGTDDIYDSPEKKGGGWNFPISCECDTMAQTSMTA